MILNGARKYTFDIIDDSTGATQKIDLVFRYMTPMDHQKMFAKGVDMESSDMETIAKGLYGLLVPDSKKKVFELPFRDFNEETGEIEDKKIPSWQKLLMLLPKGPWSAPEILMALQVGGSQERAKEIIDQAIEASQKAVEDTVKKNLIPQT